MAPVVHEQLMRQADAAVFERRRAASEDEHQLSLRNAENTRQLAQLVFEPHDVVVAVGQDGLVANVGKYFRGQPLAGVSPDPAGIEGVLLADTVDGFFAGLPEALASRRLTRAVTLAETVTNDGQVLRAFNEIFVGVPNHQSLRYHISYRGRSELQSSSGLIVATGSGSTGWLRSLLGDAGMTATIAPPARWSQRLTACRPRRDRANPPRRPRRDGDPFGDPRPHTRRLPHDRPAAVSGGRVRAALTTHRVEPPGKPGQFTASFAYLLKRSAIS